MHIKEITLKKVVSVVKLSLLIIWFWPLQPNATKRKILYMKLFQFISVLLALKGIIMALYSIGNNPHDPGVIIDSAFALFPCIHIIWNIVCLLSIYQRLQYVTLEIENFCELIKPDEEAIIRREYIANCIGFYGGAMAAFYSSVLFCLFIRPAILHEPFPINFDFPPFLNVYNQPMRTITYVHHSIVGTQIAAHLCLSAFMALLLWLVSAQFRLLAENISKITSTFELMKCIEKHQRLLDFAEEVSLAVRPFAVGSVIASTLSIIIYGFIIITASPLPLKLQCVGLGLSALSEVFMYAWPAEHLIHISTNVGDAIFDIDWYEKNATFRRNIQIVMMRSQKPTVVALPLGMPPLSLNYYATYLSTIFSYFTTLRIIFEEEKSA